MTSQEALDLARKAMELSASNLNDEKATENEKTLANLLQDTATVIMQAVEFIEVLQEESKKSIQLMEMAKMVIDAMSANQNLVAGLNSEPLVVEGHGCDCDECSEEDKCCGCEDSSECASCPTPPKNLIN